jgi:putative transposase
MEVKYVSHCSYRIRYHMIFVLKYRKNLIDNEIFEAIKDILLGITERYYLNFQAFGHERDHFHLLIEAAPRYSPSRVMQICKSITAKQLFKRFPDLEEELWGGHFWSEGGHIDTVGDGYDVKEMEAYILSQGVSKRQMKLYQFPSTKVDGESPS